MDSINWNRKMEIKMLTTEQKVLLDEIKEMMQLRYDYYLSNNFHQKAHAIKMMRVDIIEKYECEWIESNA
jgi:hypothetical protein